MTRPYSCVCEVLEELLSIANQLSIKILLVLVNNNTNDSIAEAD